MGGNVQSWERQARRKQPTRVIPHHGKLFKQQEKKKGKKTKPHREEIILAHVQIRCELLGQKCLLEHRHHLLKPS